MAYPRQALISVMILYLSLRVQTQQCRDVNCASCDSNPNVCDMCFNEYTLSREGVCKVPCAVASCTSCKIKVPSICSVCDAGYDIKVLDNSTGRNECIKRSDKETNKILLLVIVMLVVAVLCVGIMCWCVVHKKNVAAQRNMANGSDLNQSMYQGQGQHQSPLRNINQFYNPPKPIPNVTPVPNYQQFSQIQPPPPGNSLFFLHKQNPASY